MATKKRGLGRGLDALLGGSKPPGEPTRPGEVNESDGALRQLPVDRIQRGQYQPRRDMRKETLDELAASIKAQGVVQPVVVRELTAGGYELIAGERRWRAAQMAGLHEIPAVVRVVSDRAAIAMALIENIQREDLNPLEESRALDRLIREFELTHQQAAEAVGRSRTAVTNLLRLQELSDEVKQLIEDGQLEMGHARALLALSGQEQLQAARKVVQEGLTARDTEALARRIAKRKPPKPKSKQLDPDIRRLQDDLSAKLGAEVRIEQAGKRKGRLIIRYNSLDELDGILDRIR